VAHYGANAIRVFAGDGRLLDSLFTSGNPTNVCFGGPRFEHLVVTIDDRGELHAYDLGTVGARINFCPALAESHHWALA
jgi:sugar lactone lactonase YvrE